MVMAGTLSCRFVSVPELLEFLAGCKMMAQPWSPTSTVQLRREELHSRGQLSSRTTRKKIHASVSAKLPVKVNILYRAGQKSELLILSEHVNKNEKTGGT